MRVKRAHRVMSRGNAPPLVIMDDIKEERRGRQLLALRRPKPHRVASLGPGDGAQDGAEPADEPLPPAHPHAPWSFPARSVAAAAGLVGPLRMLSVACGSGHVLMLDERASVWASGRGCEGQLGLGTTSDAAEPTLLKALYGVRVGCIAAGGWHSVAVAAEGGATYTWGDNARGQLGQSSAHARFVMVPTRVDVPAAAAAAAPGAVAAAYAGAHFTLLVTAVGRCLTAGCNSNGQIGSPDMCGGSSVSEFVPIVAGMRHKRVTHAACGEAHAVVCTEDGDVWTWGRGTELQLGHGDHEARTSPGVVEALLPVFVQRVAAGPTHTVVSTDAGGARAVTTAATQPRRRRRRGGSVSCLSCLPSHYGRRAAVYAFGSNMYGALGLGAHTRESALPKRVKSIASVRDVAAGSFHTLYVDGTASLFSVGSGAGGRLGHVYEHQDLAGSGVRPLPHLERPAMVTGLHSVGKTKCGRASSAASVARDVVWPNP